MPKVIELQEKLDAEKAKTAKIEADLATERAKNQQREFSAWLGSEEMRTKISPAIKTELQDIMEFASATESFEFSAPDPADETKTVKIKQAPAEKVKAFMRRYLPDIITFGEVATKKAAGGNKTDMTNAQDISAKALEFQHAEKEAGRVITITEAVNHVMQS